MSTTLASKLAARQSRKTTRGKIGLVAAWGRYPLVIAEALIAQGYEVHCAGVMEHADTSLPWLVHDFQWIGLGKLGQALRYFRRAGVKQVTMAGKFHKVKLFQRGIWLKHLPDWRAIRTFGPHFWLNMFDRKDDTLLGLIVREFARDGITVEPATNYLPELLVKLGQLTARAPTSRERTDIAFGWKLAREMGRLDIGQSVAVKGRAALAVEAIEGTDECIRRAGVLCEQGEFTVVKVAKPKQDMRYDVPTIGMGTLRSLVEAGGRVLAIEADKTIVIDQAEVIRFADEHRLTVVAVNDEEALGGN